jgi:ATP-binding cassette subfamily B protein/ATP-binding cassette subfamily C protein
MTSAGPAHSAGEPSEAGPAGPGRPEAGVSEDGSSGAEADELSAELASAYWAAYRDRMATIGFLAMARQFPGLVRHAIRLGSQASRWDTVATIAANLASGIFTGYALLASTTVLQALFAAGPTPGRVRAAVPSLALVAGAVAARSALQAAAGWSEARLEPQIERAVETRLFELTTSVPLSAFDDSEFNDAMLRARDRGVISAARVVKTVLDCLTGAVGIVSAAVVVSVLNPVLLVLLLVAELPGGWAAVRSARIGYATNFALADARRRKWILSDLMAERRTAAEVRSFTFAPFLLTRFRQLLTYERDAELVAARRQALTRVAANVAGGVATAAVYIVLGVLLAAGTVPLAVAGTAVLAIRSAQSSLAQLLYSVNQCYEEGLYFSDYLAFCSQAAGLTPPPGGRGAPAGFDRITVEHVTFSYPGAAKPALRGVSVEIGRGEVVALVGENGSGKTTLAKVLAGLYQPDSGAVSWDRIPTSDMDPDQLRERIAVIAQDHVNWPLTVAHNIVMGRAADDRELARAARVAGADLVIGELPRGFRTLLDRQFAGGVELSGGQWQRIAVARGFYRAAPLLIMDEPTAALDARAEYALFSSFRQHARGRSVLIITHRLASVRQADRVYVLHGGRVTEQGTHAELMARRGHYAELYTLQASQYDHAPG